MLSLLARPASASTHVGRYRIGKPWDECSGCYLAEEPNGQVEVIVRTAALDSSARMAFLQSLRAIGNLEHDHIVPMIDSGETDDGCYFVCDPLNGETLQTQLNREHRLPLNHAIRIACEIASALTAIHALGLIHRDVCPANVWMDASGCARLTGFAPEPGDDSSLLKRLSGPGTPGYLSPEQAAGEAVTASSDLFSLGCILYQMATGVAPFQGPNSAALCRAVIFDDPHSARELNPEVSAALENLLTGLLAKMPSDRPAKAAKVQAQLMEMIEPIALQTLMQPLPTVRIYPASKRILNTLAQTRNLEPAPTVPTVSRLDVIMAPPPLPQKRRTWLPDLVAGLLLVVGAAGLYLWWKASNETPPQPPAVKQEQGKR
jgi:serine/threonine protein kinase